MGGQRPFGDFGRMCSFDSAFSNHKGAWLWYERHIGTGGSGLLGTLAVGSLSVMGWFQKKKEVEGIYGFFCTDITAGY